MYKRERVTNPRARWRSRDASCVVFPGAGGAVVALPPSTLSIILCGELTDQNTTPGVRVYTGAGLRVDRRPGDAGRGQEAKGKEKVRVGGDAILSFGLNQLFCGPRPARPTHTQVFLASLHLYSGYNVEKRMRETITKKGNHF